MNKTLTKITAMAMAVAVALSFSSCEKKKEVLASKENIFSSQKIAIPEGLDYLNNIFYANDSICILGEKSRKEGEGENTVYINETVMQIVDMEGNLVNEKVISNDSNRYIYSVNIDNNGNMVTLENCFFWNEETGESNEENYVVKYDGEGNVVSEINLDKASEAVKKETGSDWFSVYNFVMADDGTLVLNCDNLIVVADKDGTIKFLIKNDFGENSWMDSIYKTGDGRVFAVVTVSEQKNDEYRSESKLCEIDFASQKFGAEYAYNQTGAIMNGNNKYDLLISRDSGLYGYDIEDGKAEIIIDWLKSGIDTTALNNRSTAVLDDGRILCVTYDYNYEGGGAISWSGGKQIINMLTPIDPETLPDKKLVKLYAMFLDAGIRRQVAEFNKMNQEYEIEITSYDEFSANSYSDAVTKLNNDMISGNLPDILIINDSLPVDSYISKGLFADLYEFMDKDETINREDYLENVFKAYEVGGKLYQLITSFNIETVVGKTSQVGDTQGWTMDEFIEFVDTYPDISVFGSEMVRDGFFLSAITHCYENFIDVETGKCTFNSDEFVKILEFATRFPKEIDSSIYEDPNYWQESETAYRNGKTLLNMYYMNTFTGIRELELGTFGEPVTLKGYPGAEGNGSVILAYNGIAITSKAANPDGAWEFVKYFLSDEYQDHFTYEFPIKLSSLEKQMEKAKEKPYYIDENGDKIEYDNKFWIGDQEIDIGVNTDEDNQRVLDYIKSVTTVGHYDENIFKIINEEAGAFFEGQKSAKEVADIIQNRVSTYIAENM